MTGWMAPLGHLGDGNESRSVVRQTIASCFGFLTACAFMSCPQVSVAQENNPTKIGVILQGGSWYAVVDGLRDGLKQLGLTEGKEFILDVRDTGGDVKNVEEVAKDLERKQTRLIYTIATSVSLAAKRATQQVAQVFITGTDPVAVQLADSTARPGGRSTGVHFQSTNLMGKRLELLREIIPGLRRVVTFSNPENRSAVESTREGREAAQSLGLEFIARPVTSVEELHKSIHTG